MILERNNYVFIIIIIIRPFMLLHVYIQILLCLGTMYNVKIELESNYYNP